VGDPRRHAAGVRRRTRRAVSAPALAGGVRFRRMPDGQGVLLIPEGVVDLNESASAIVELIDGRRTVAAIASDLSPQYGVDIAQITDDVEVLLKRLAANAWLVYSGPEAR
jgi:pyrroloquinoline quinone biosynthesis protein D